MKKFVVCGLATLLLGTAAAGAAEPQPLEAPAARASGVIRTYGGERVLLVKNFTAEVPTRAHVHIECGCAREAHRIEEHDPRPGLKKYSAVYWILRKDSRITLTVTESGMLGRYLVLKRAEPLSHRNLAEVSSGCLSEAGRRVACPPPPHEEEKKGGNGTNELAPISGLAETVGGETHTHSDYASAGGTEGPVIHTGETVQIACRVQGQAVEDGDTWWYRIASSPWNSVYYASADAFYNNGEKTGTLIGTPFFDPAVPQC
jgi:hypothetical protein